jgi:hypothetical protein
MGSTPIRSAMNQKQKSAIKDAIHFAEQEDLPEHQAVVTIAAELRNAFPELANQLDKENNEHDTISRLASEAGKNRTS